MKTTQKNIRNKIPKIESFVNHFGGFFSAGILSECTKIWFKRAQKGAIKKDIIVAISISNLKLDKNFQTIR